MFMKYWLFGYRLNYRVKTSHFYCQMPSDCIDYFGTGTKTEITSKVVQRFCVVQKIMSLYLCIQTKYYSCLFSSSWNSKQSGPQTDWGKAS